MRKGERKRERKRFMKSDRERYQGRKKCMKITKGMKRRRECN
jgi:hypothetical protein